MCNCIDEKMKELEVKLPEMLKEKDSGFIEMKSFHMSDYVFSFDGSKAPPFLLKFEARYNRKLKNGNIKSKTMPVSMTPTHCPLCGGKYGE